jgi:hypothetical protein
MLSRCEHSTAGDNGGKPSAASAVLLSLLLLSLLRAFRSQLLPPKPAHVSRTQRLRSLELGTGTFPRAPERDRSGAVLWLPG